MVKVRLRMDFFEQGLKDAREAHEEHMRVSEAAMRQLVDVDKRAALVMELLPSIRQDVADVKASQRLILQHLIDYQEGRTRTRSEDRE